MGWVVLEPSTWCWSVFCWHESQLDGRASEDVWLNISSWGTAKAPRQALGTLTVCWNTSKWFILTYLTRFLWGLVNICKVFMDRQHIKYCEPVPSYLPRMTWERTLVFLSTLRILIQQPSAWLFVSSAAGQEWQCLSSVLHGDLSF